MTDGKLQPLVPECKSIRGVRTSVVVQLLHDLGDDLSHGLNRLNVLLRLVKLLLHVLQSKAHCRCLQLHANIISKAILTVLELLAVCFMLPHFLVRLLAARTWQTWH